jgi:ABC-type Fe3+/spermidine/putrescine transport system ATPase subunit
MQIELTQLQRDVGITFVFVTHHQEEALTMSDRIAVFNDGRIEQVGPSRDVYERPRTRFVAEFLGAANFFTGTVTTDATGRTVVRSPAGFEMPIDWPAAPADVCFVVRPEKLRLTRAPARPGSPAMPVTIEDRIYQGMTTVWAVRNDRGERFTVVQQNVEHAEDDLNTAARAFICWDPRHGVLLDVGLSPSPGTPGEGGGEGSAQATLSDRSASTSRNPHPDPLPEYRERQAERTAHP